MRKLFLFIVFIFFNNIAFASAAADSLQIQEPADQSTLWNAQGDVTVMVQAPMPLPDGQHFQLLLDNQKYGELQAASVWYLVNIPRGSHQIQVQLFDKNGKVLNTSLSSVFYLHRPFHKS